MFNNRVASRQSNTQNQDRIDAVTFAKLRTKNLEQRIVARHDREIRSLNEKVQKIVNNPDSELNIMKEKYETQSKILSDYETKMLNLVNYIRKLEKGLEAVKGLLVNKTNTPDTSNVVSAPVEEKVEESVPVEEKVEESVPVEEKVEESVPVEEKVEESAPVEEKVEESASVEEVESVEEVKKESDGEVDENVSLEIVEE
jgi:hypothetical protein